MNQDPGRPGMATDSLVVLAALVSLCEEYFSARGGGPPLALGLLGFGLDLVFVGLFCLRYAQFASTRGTDGFWGEDRNWIEFLASFPVLVLVSGPFCFASLLGGAQVAALALAPLLPGLNALRLVRLLRFSERGRIGAAPLARAHLQKAVSIALCSTLAAATLLELVVSDSGLAAPIAFAGSLMSLIVSLSLVLAYGPFVLRSEEEALVLRDRLFEALRKDGAAPAGASLARGGTAGAAVGGVELRRGPASRAEIEGLLSRASRYNPQGEEGPW